MAKEVIITLSKNEAIRFVVAQMRSFPEMMVEIIIKDNDSDVAIAILGAMQNKRIKLRTEEMCKKNPTSSDEKVFGIAIEQLVRIAEKTRPKKGETTFLMGIQGDFANSMNHILKIMRLANKSPKRLIRNEKP